MSFPEKGHYDGICLESVYTEVTDYEKDGLKAVGDAEVRGEDENTAKLSGPGPFRLGH